MKTKKILNSFVVLSLLLGLVMTNAATAFANGSGQDNSQNKSEKANGVPGGFLGGLWNSIMHRQDVNKKEMQFIYGTVSSVSGNTINVSVTEKKLLNVPQKRAFGTSTRPEYGTSTRPDYMYGTNTEQFGTSTWPGYGTGTKPEFNRNMRPELLATTTTIVYTIDATNAKIYEGRATTTVSNIAVGNMVWVQGKVTGENVTANVIMVMAIPTPKVGDKGNKNNQLTGDGQPVVAGTISSVSSTTIIITNSGSSTYTVDITNAKVFEGNKVASSSALSVGDAVVVQGAVNGTSITASTVIGQNEPAGKEAPKGFIGSIGSFFSRLFKF